MSVHAPVLCAAPSLTFNLRATTCDHTIQQRLRRLHAPVSAYRPKSFFLTYHEPVGTPGPRQSDRRRTSEPTQVTNATLRRSEDLKIQYGTSLSDRNWARAPPAHARAYYGVEGGRGRRARSRFNLRSRNGRVGVWSWIRGRRLEYLALQVQHETRFLSG